MTWLKRRLKRPDVKEQGVTEELHRAKDTLDRIWALVEFDGRVSDDIVDEIDQVVRAYRYGTAVESKGERK